MRPETRLDSAVFQLTPTRTRCDLVVIANGRKEKIASGLLNPFVAHLKVAQEQIAKGGYSITLAADPEIDAPWFTRGTVERFVRFVSTPEVLERVTTIESEILQIEDAITVQGSDNLGLRSVEDYNEKLVECIGGTKTNYDPDVDKSLVLYKPGMQPPPPVQNDNTTQEENSKVQLLRVLETRKTVLRKEQAMAFARAVAAGFNIDNLGYLITFADRFGASRLMKACTQFTELWRRKHETGQWIEVEPEAMSARSEFPPFNASGIMFMGDNMKQNLETLSVSHGDANGEDAAKADLRTAQHSGAPSEYLHGPYQSAYPQWAIHPPYPMQGMPYYPGVSPYYPPPYPPMDDPRYHHSERRVSRKYSSDGKDSDEESGQSGSEVESSHGHKLHKKGKRSGKKKPSVVVIRNINVKSKKYGSSESESQTGSDVASEDSDDSHTKYSKRKHKSSSSKKKESRKTILEPGDEYRKDEASHRQDGDQGNWNVFQSFLLRDEEKTRDNDTDLFANEKEPPPARRKERRTTDDPLLLVERDYADVNEGRTVGFNSAYGRIRPTRMLSGDELMISSDGKSFVDGDIKEIEAGGGGYRRGAGDDFMVYGQEKPMDSGCYLDPLAEAQYKSPTLMEKNMHSVGDESFMIPVRSNSHDNLGPESCTTIDIDVELPGTVQKTSYAKAEGQLFYEPDELMPEREFEDVTYGYDPAMDYDSQMQIQPAITVEDANAEDASLGFEGEVKKVDKNKKLRSSQESLDKRKDTLARRLPSSKSRVTDAQKRAQNLRAYKADLQKAKKEQEEEQVKRLEKLKQERQKRIAARSSTSNSISAPQQAKAKPSPKISPSTHKSSKFSDAEPGSFSPLRKLPARTTPESDRQKTGKASKLSESSTNAVSKSTSSMAEMKKEKNGRNELSSERLKKLAEPKSNALTDHPSNPKSASADHLRRRSMPEDTQTKKISAIMQLDQRKSATLPELKVKSPRAPSTSVKNRTDAKELRDGEPRGLGNETSPTSEVTDGNKANGEVSRMSNNDDNVVVEKTVVILENEVVSVPPVILPPGRTAENETSSNDRTRKPSPELEYTAIRAPPSPAALPEAESFTIHRHDDQGNSYEAMTEHGKDEAEELTLAAVEKPYQAPYARVTSLENDSAISHALPVQESETLVHAESIRARVPDPVCTVSVEETHETNERPRNKESKGFRKLLKFGRKSHTSGTMDPDASSVDGAVAGDGSMLKTLISQDDSGSSSKASRSFSLLSPFRRQKVIVL
uniref:COP1-interacting protein-related n=1 Tax=Leersia perrieri TaxID=77586 RepID=A0A0D9W1N8_9ORYZ